MTDDFCPWEARTVEAERSGHWPDDLEAHVAECSRCEQTLTVAGFMTQTSERFGRNETAPDPTLIWLKSELAKRDEEANGERRARLWSRGMTGLAATAVGWAAVQSIPAALALDSQTLAATGAGIVLALAILYFAAYKPLKDVVR
jgi:hypothetical protein